MYNNTKTAIGSAILCLFVGNANATDVLSPADLAYQAAYQAGYQAAIEAMKSGNTTIPPVATTPAAVAPPANATPVNPNEPQDWWNHSALLYDKLTPEWRHHGELQASGSSLGGNESGSAIRGSGKLFSRRNQWTNELVFTIDKRSINQAGGISNKRDSRMFQESVRYDLGAKLYTAVGYIWETDDTSYINNRNTWLAGLGYYVFDNPHMRLNLFAGLGRLNETYLDPVPALIGNSGRSSNLLYVYETFDWQIAENWSLQQGFRQIRDLQESNHYIPDPLNPAIFTSGGMVKRYRNVANVSVNYKLSPKSSVGLTLEARHDSNPWPDVVPTDIVKRLTFNMMF
jgi:putative salt-induced outer membrane protein YdiY